MEALDPIYADELAAAMAAKAEHETDARKRRRRGDRRWEHVPVQAIDPPEE